MNFKKILSAITYPFDKYIESRAEDKFHALMEAEDIGWTKVGSSSDYGLSADKTEKMVQVSAKLWRQNPIAKRIMQMYQTHIVGDGAEIQAEDPKVQEVLDNHWRDPANNWDFKQFSRCTTLFLFGELALKAFVNTHNGHVRLGYIDPLSVDEIKKNKDNAEQVEKIKLDEKDKWYNVIGYDYEPFSENYSRLKGDVFLFQINKLPNAERGIGELYPLADWLDSFDQFIYSALERINFLNAYIWDIEINGANQKKIQKKIDQLKSDPPRPGTVRVHNENVSWDTVSPKIASGDIETLTDVLRGIIMGGAGLAFHWIGAPKTVNRATAREAERPAYQFLKSRQRIFRHVIERICRFCIDKAILAGKLSESVNTSFKVVLPQVDEATFGDISDSLGKVIKAVAVGVESKILDLEDGQEIIQRMTNQLGFEMDLSSDKEAIPEELEAYESYMKKIFKEKAS